MHQGAERRGGRDRDGWMEGEKTFFFPPPPSLVAREKLSPETPADSPARGSHRAQGEQPLSVSYEFNTAVKNTRGNIAFISLSLASLNAAMAGWLAGDEEGRRFSFGRSLSLPLLRG